MFRNYKFSSSGQELKQFLYCSSFLITEFISGRYTKFISGRYTKFRSVSGLNLVPNGKAIRTNSLKGETKGFCLDHDLCL